MKRLQNFLVVKRVLGIIALTTGISSMGFSYKEEQTLAYYNQRAHKWIEHAASKQESYYEHDLTIFNTLLPQGRLLEIGVGGALEASRLLALGYEYVGIDPVGAFIDAAQHHYPQGLFLQQSVYDLNVEPSSFDGFWCAATLLHIPYKRIDDALQQIKTCMKSGAIGYISLLEGEGEFLDETSGRFFYFYTQDEFADILRRNGFIIKQQAIRKKDTQKEWLRTWLTYFVRVP